MKIKTIKTWSYTISSSDTAHSVLNRIIKQRKNDVKGHITRPSYKIREFALDTDMDGRKLPCAKYNMSPRTIDSIISSLDGGRTRGFDSALKQISRQIGLPNIRRPKGKYFSKNIKTREEIEEQIRFLRKKMCRKERELTEICEDVSTQSVLSEMIAAIGILEWTYNCGNIRSWDEIVDRIFDFKVKLERDKLFHSRRHKKDKSMHHSFNSEVEGIISELEWCLEQSPWHGFFENPDISRGIR